MLFVEDTRCHCTSGVDVCGRMWSGQYILVYLQCVLLCKISYGVRSCVAYVKYCNHLSAMDTVGVACRGLWYVCGWKNVKRYRGGSP